MKTSLCRALLLAGLVIVPAGCEGVGEDQVLAVEATGSISGVLYVDANGNGVFDGGDRRIPGVRTTLRLWGPGSIIAITSTDENGTFRIPRTPAGTYRIEVDSSVLGDTLQVGDGPFNEFTLTDGASLAVDIGLRPR